MEDNKIKLYAELTSAVPGGFVVDIDMVKGLAEKLQPLSITYDELKNLKLKGELVSGQQYRITDFETTTSSYKCSVHPDARFDIVVTAVSGNELSEEARAVHREGNTYFANSRLSEWKLKYCIDNDSSRFEWAVYGDALSQGTTYVASPKDDVTYYGTYYYAFVSATGNIVYSVKPFPGNSDSLFIYEEDYFEGWVMVNAGVFSAIARGKGVIYYMKDEFGNEAPYDFKSMKIRSGFDAEDTVIGVAPSVYYFTFNKQVDGVAVDHSLTGKCRNNVIKPLVEDGIQKINHIIFNHTDIMPESSDNFIDADCKSILFGGQCFNNTVGKNCYLIRLQGSNRDNVIGNQCEDFQVGQGCERNKFGDKCEKIIFGMNVCDNVLDNMCSNIFVGVGSSANSFGKRSESITLGAYCLCNIFESDVTNIKFENIEIQDATALTSVSSYCWHNHFESGVSGLKFIFENGNFPDKDNVLQNIHAVKGYYGDGENLVSDIRFNMTERITLSPKKQISANLCCDIDYEFNLVPVRDPVLGEDCYLSVVDRAPVWKDIKGIVPDIPAEVMSVLKTLCMSHLEFFNGFVSNVEILEASMVGLTGFEGIYFDQVAGIFVAKYGDLYYNNWKTYESDRMDFEDEDFLVLDTKIFYNVSDGKRYVAGTDPSGKYERLPSLL